MTLKINGRFNSVELARKTGKNLMSFPLTNKSSAKVLFDDTSVDCYIVKNGKIIGGRGETCKPENFEECLAVVIDKIKKYVVPGFDIDKELIRGFSGKNVI